MSYMKTTLTPVTTDKSFNVEAFEELVRTMTAPVTPHVMTTTMGGATYTTVSAPKGKTLTAKARVNKGTMEAYGGVATHNMVKRKMVKELLEQLINSGVVTVTSDVSKTGAVTFTASVVVHEAA